MKHLILYENFQTEEEIVDICKKYHIENWSINSDELIDVDGDVDLSEKYLDRIPLKFGTVTGDFNCGYNQLTSLEGSPKYVGGNFYCHTNQLTSLEGSPKEVGGSFYCNYNQLTNLEGGPSNVGRDFYCHNNKLVNLEGSPIKVGGDFYCIYNELVSLEGAPDFVGSNFYCDDNPIFNIWELFKDYSKIELFNYYDIVRELDGKPAIVLARLNQFLEDIGKKSVENIKGYINI